MAPPSPHSVAVFTLDQQRIALDVMRVRQVIRAVEVTPLPDAPAGVRGVIDVHGKITPVFDLRVRFDRPLREIHAADHLVLVETGSRQVALLVDTIVGVVEAQEDRVQSAAGLSADARSLGGVLSLEGDIVLIHDLDGFLSPAEDRTLTDALRV